MKKIVMFILIFVSISSLYADFKVMGGINLSKYSKPNRENFHRSYKMGFMVGFGLEKNITQNMLLEFDLLFFQKGSKAKFDNFPYLKSKYYLNVISIPVLLRYQFLFGSSPFVLAGLELSYILSHKKNIEGQDSIDIKNETKKSDFGYLIGCGYQLELQEDLFFFIEARYHFGDRSLTNNILESPMKTYTILFLVGLRS